MLYQQSQQLIMKAEGRLRDGDISAARDACRRAGELQWELVKTRQPDQVRTRSIFGLSAATLFHRAGDEERAEQIATYLLSQDWLERRSHKKLRELLHEIGAQLEHITSLTKGRPFHTGL